MTVNKWVPTTDTTELRVLGKALEECGELTAVMSRCIIQGIDEAEPTTGKINRHWLEEEMADVYATLRILSRELNLNHDRIVDRISIKVAKLEAWKELLKDVPK